MFSAATGEDWDVERMMKAGERAWNLKRAINIRLGLTRATEKLPKLLLQALPDGGQEGHLPDMDILLRNTMHPAAGTKAPANLYRRNWLNWVWILF